METNLSQNRKNQKTSNRLRRGILKIEQVVGDYLDANVFLVEKDGHLVIIDSGASLEKILPFVKGKKVEGVCLTHAHFDHALHCQEYAKEFGCKIYVNEHGKEILQEHEKNYSNDFEIKDFSLFEFIANDGKLRLGNFEIEYFYTPGHSPCAVCYKIDQDLFAGDTLFSNSIGRTDLYKSNKQQMISSLEKLDKINFLHCYSGHGEMSDYARQKRNIKVFIRFLQR